MINQLLETAEDIVPVRKLEGERYVVAFPFRGEIARECFEKTLVNPVERDVPAFQKYWKFNEETGEINGSSTCLALRLDKRLREDGLWIPSVPEARALDNMGRLKNRVYRDFGIAVFDDSAPNQKTAKALVGQAKSMKLPLPLLVPYKSLDYQLDKESDSGIAPSLFDAKWIISGEDAVKMLEKFNYVERTSVRWLGRDRNGDWVACLGSLGGSDDDGRVDFVCGEAARADLVEAHKKLIGRKYAQKALKLQEQKEKESAEFASSLN